MFQELKAGDDVFVAPERRSGIKEGSYRVSRVGRKYGYIEIYRIEYAFCLKSGFSYSPREENTHMNGFGFQVFPSEARYLAFRHEKQRRSDLHKILLENSKFRWVDSLDFDLVEELLTTFEEYGITAEKIK